jgi:Glycosyltransferase family 87
VSDSVAGSAAVAQPVTLAGSRTGRLAVVWRDWRSSVKPALLGFVAYRIVTELIGLFSTYGTRTLSVLHHSPEAALRIWDHWDGQWYLAIATLGYARTSHFAPNGTPLDSSAFAPLFPALIRGTMDALHVDAVAAAFLIVNVALVVALIGLHRLARLDVGQRGANVALLLALAYPTALFFGAFYAESLLLALLVWSFLAARSGHWWLAGLLAGAAVLTKVYTAVILLALAVEYMQAHGWRLRNIRVDALAIVAGPLGALGLLMLYMQRTRGDALSFLHAEAGWHHQLSAPWTAFTQSISDVVKYAQSIAGLNGGGFMSMLDIVTVLGLLVAAAFAWFRLRRSYAVFILASDGVFMTSGNLYSATRYALATFPLFILGAMVLRNRLKLTAALVVPSAVLSGFLIHGFVTDRWVG